MRFRPAGVRSGPVSCRPGPGTARNHPLTVYVVDRDGVHRYRPQTHALQRTLPGDLRPRLQAAALDQPCVGSAPLCVVLALDVTRTATTYGSRAERYGLLEAGHAAQNVLLQATALGLTAVPVGAFTDREVTDLLRLAPPERPVYLLPVGHPPEE